MEPYTLVIFSDEDYQMMCCNSLDEARGNAMELPEYIDYDIVSDEELKPLIKFLTSGGRHFNGCSIF